MKKQERNLIPSDEILITKIHIIRNHKIMLDKDLAELFGVIPRRLREQVKRNIERFPKNFMFQLTEAELEIVVSQNATPSKSTNDKQKDINHRLH